MTPRQREFAHHYLRGLPAKEAAKAAGYAHATAEKNAAEILRSEAVQAWLQRHRAAKAVLTHQDLDRMRLRLIKTLDTGTDMEASRACAQLIALGYLQARLDPEPVPAPMTAAQNPAQEPDTEIREIDTLPSGHDGFDTRIAPVKPDITKPRTPINIVFRTLASQKEGHTESYSQAP